MENIIDLYNFLISLLYYSFYAGVILLSIIIKKEVLTMTPMKWFYSFLRKYWLRMAAGLLLVTMLSAAALAGPYISKLIVDDVINKGNTKLLLKLVACLIALVIVKGVCRFFSHVLFGPKVFNLEEDD